MNNKISDEYFITLCNLESHLYDLYDRGSIFIASSSHLEGNNNSMQPCIGLKRVPCQTIKELSTIRSGFLKKNVMSFYFDIQNSKSMKCY